MFARPRDGMTGRAGRRERLTYALQLFAIHALLAGSMSSKKICRKPLSRAELESESLGDEGLLQR